MSRPGDGVALGRDRPGRIEGGKSPRNWAWGREAMLEKINPKGKRDCITVFISSGFDFDFEWPLNETRSKTHYPL